MIRGVLSTFDFIVLSFLFLLCMRSMPQQSWSQDRSSSAHHINVLARQNMPQVKVTLDSSFNSERKCCSSNREHCRESSLLFPPLFFTPFRQIWSASIQSPACRECDYHTGVVHGVFPVGCFPVCLKKAGWTGFDFQRIFFLSFWEHLLIHLIELRQLDLRQNHQHNLCCTKSGQI